MNKSNRRLKTIDFVYGMLTNVIARGFMRPEATESEGEDTPWTPGKKVIA